MASMPRRRNRPSSPGCPWPWDRNCGRDIADRTPCWRRSKRPATGHEPGSNSGKVRAPEPVHTPSAWDGHGHSPLDLVRAIPPTLITRWTSSCMFQPAIQVIHHVILLLIWLLSDFPDDPRESPTQRKTKQAKCTGVYMGLRQSAKAIRDITAAIAHQSMLKVDPFGELLTCGLVHADFPGDACQPRRYMEPGLVVCKNR